MGALGVVGTVGGLGAVGAVGPMGKVIFRGGLDVTGAAGEVGVIGAVGDGGAAAGPGYSRVRKHMVAARFGGSSSVQCSPAQPGPAPLAPARLCSLIGGIYSARASGILTDEATARLLHCLNHSMQISRTGCSAAATPWGFPGPMGSGALGAAAAVRRSPGPEAGTGTGQVVP